MKTSFHAKVTCKDGESKEQIKYGEPEQTEQEAKEAAEVLADEMTEDGFTVLSKDIEEDPIPEK